MKPEVFVPAKFPCIPDAPYFMYSYRTGQPIMRIYSLNCIEYKAHLLYRTTVDNEKNIDTHVEEIRESTELNLSIHRFWPKKYCHGPTYT